MTTPNRTSLRDAAVARARADGFREAGDLLRVLADASLPTSAIAAAMTARAVDLDAEAETAEVAARDGQKARADYREERAEKAS